MPKGQQILASLPAPLTRWIGYRPSPPPKQPEYIILLWSFIGSFCGISVIQAVFSNANYFIQRSAPSIVASYVRNFLFHIPMKRGHRWLCVGCQCNPNIRCDRITARATSRIVRRSFCWGPSRGLHHKTVSPFAYRGTFPGIAMACGIAFVCCVNGCYADNVNDTPTRRWVRAKTLHNAGIVTHNHRMSRRHRSFSGS